MADLIVDTYKLNQYAERLSSVNSRINQLDSRLDSLYWRVGLLGLWNLIQADIFTGYSWRLERCKVYLEQTASDFENLEKELDYDKFASALSNRIFDFSLFDVEFDNPAMTDTNGFPPNPVDVGKISKIMKEYFNLMEDDGDIKEKTRGVIKWLSSIRSDASTYKEYAEWASGYKLEWPKPVATGFDFIKGLDTSNKLIFGILEYGKGVLNGDLDSMTDGANDLLGALKTGVAETIKTNNAMTDFMSGLLLDYGKNMVSNWLESIQTETEVSEVYWNTFAKSAIQVFDDTICNTQTLAIAYEPAIFLSNAVGFDLQGAYEKVSNKKGFEAVTDTFSQTRDIIMENFSWKNWKSGMSAIVDGVAGWFK